MHIHNTSIGVHCHHIWDSNCLFYKKKAYENDKFQVHMH